MIHRITVWVKRVVRRLLNWLKKWQVWGTILLLLISVILVVLIQRTSFDWRPYDSSAQNVRNPTLWDFLELFIVPIILTLGGLLYERISSQREQKRQKEERELEQKRQNLEEQKNRAEIESREKLREITERERYQRVNLREFMDRIEARYASKGERLFDVDEPARATARARVKHVLHQADLKRKQHVIDFLLDSKLTLVTDERDAKHCLLEGFSLKQTDFCGLKMRRFDLTDVNLEGSRFEMAPDLSGACLSNANVSRVNFSGALLSDANLSGVHTNVEPNASKKNQTFFSHSQMERCDLSHTQLWNVQFDNATLIEAKLYAAYLHKCTIAGESNLSQVMFGGENEEQEQRTRIEQTNFINSNLSQVKFMSCDIVNCTIDRCDLTQAAFFNAWLSNVDLRTSYIDSSTDFSNASLEKVTLPTGELSGISFKNAQLTDISFEDIDFTDANFAGAALRNVSFLGCNLAEVDFTEAHFEKCTFENTNLHKANFTEITVEGFICVDKDLECVKWLEDELSSFAELGGLLRQRVEQQEDTIFDSLVIDAILSNTIPPT